MHRAYLFCDHSNASAKVGLVQGTVTLQPLQCIRSGWVDPGTGLPYIAITAMYPLKLVGTGDNNVVITAM